MTGPSCWRYSRRTGAAVCASTSSMRTRSVRRARVSSTSPALRAFRTHARSPYGETSPASPLEEDEASTGVEYFFPVFWPVTVSTCARFPAIPSRAARRDQLVPEAAATSSAGTSPPSGEAPPEDGARRGRAGTSPAQTRAGCVTRSPAVDEADADRRGGGALSALARGRSASRCLSMSHAWSRTTSNTRPNTAPLTGMERANRKWAVPRGPQQRGVRVVAAEDADGPAAPLAPRAPATASGGGCAGAGGDEATYALLAARRPTRCTARRRRLQALVGQRLGSSRRIRVPGRGCRRAARRTAARIRRGAREEPPPPLRGRPRPAHPPPDDGTLVGAAARRRARRPAVARAARRASTTACSETGRSSSCARACSAPLGPDILARPPTLERFSPACVRVDQPAGSARRSSTSARRGDREHLAGGVALARAALSVAPASRRPGGRAAAARSTAPRR